jgi:ferredoxin-NADP reductase
VVTEEPQKDGESPKEKRKFSLPALAVSALAFPLGWYLNDRYGNGSSSEARTSQPGEFVEYTLVGKESVSSTCAIFRMRPAATVVVDLDEPSAERAITSVEFKQPQLQIARSYTCLPQAQGQPMDEIRFLIRKEQHGEVSSFLHRLPIGSKIELRGLRAEYHIPNDVTNALLLVGGTGIAPALQAADKLAGSANVHILWASRRREDCVGGTNDNIPVKRPTSWWQGSFTTPNDAKSKVEPQSTDLPNAEKGALVTMLESLKRQTRASPEQQHRLHVDYFVDEEGSMVKPEDVKRILKSLSRANPPTEEGRSIILVSGPPGFITYWAGSKQWAGGREVPGPLRGVLSTMDLSGWEVVKL